MSNVEPIEEPAPKRGRLARVIQPQGSPIPATPMEMLGVALQQNANVDVLEKLMALQERWSASQARKAFDEAIANAKAEIPVISKNRTVDFTSQKGRTHYRYEDLGEIASVVTPILARHGLSYRFRTSAELNAPVIVTCIISHRDGHYEENSLPGPRDESGNKNAIQAIGSTLTYLQRMTLKASLGLAASDDDDGAASGKSASISDEQATKLNALIEDTKADVAKFKQHFRIEEIVDLPASRFDEAMRLLQQKKQSR